MKVFISWSGEFSRSVAERLSIWIQIILQTVDVFYSPNDIEKGENWGNRLSEELEQSNFGIVCLTPENVTAPWIHFEAGALSKAANSRVSAVMLGVTPSDIKGPLARLQNTACNREDFFRLFQSINNSNDLPLKPEILKNAFDYSWERLNSDINSIIKVYASRIPEPKPKEIKKEQHSNDSDALQEILRLVRNLDNGRATLTSRAVLPFNYDLNLSRNSNDGAKKVILSCAPEHIESVLSLIYEHTPFISDMPSLESMLRKHGTCIAYIHEQRLNRFLYDMNKYMPDVKVDLL